FFQAEDGIRDRNVTGVQTCALPILGGSPFALSACCWAAPRPPRCVPVSGSGLEAREGSAAGVACGVAELFLDAQQLVVLRDPFEIGRASCRESGETVRGGGAEQQDV